MSDTNGNQLDKLDVNSCFNDFFNFWRTKNPTLGWRYEKLVTYFILINCLADRRNVNFVLLPIMMQWRIIHNNLRIIRAISKIVHVDCLKQSPLSAH